MLDFQQNISEKKSPRDRFSESLFSIPYNESGTPSQGVINLVICGEMTKLKPT